MYDKVVSNEHGEWDTWQGRHARWINNGRDRQESRDCFGCHEPIEQTDDVERPTTPVSRLGFVTYHRRCWEKLPPKKS